MKTIALVLSLFLAGCASAMPPPQKPSPTGSVEFPLDVRVQAVNIYKANDPDTAWTLHTTLRGGAGDFVTFPVDESFRYYVAESTNSTGLSSQFGNVATNDSLKPVTIKLGK